MAKGQNGFLFLPWELRVFLFSLPQSSSEAKFCYPSHDLWYSSHRERGSGRALCFCHRGSFSLLPRPTTKEGFFRSLPHAQLFSSAPSEAHRQRPMSRCKFPSVSSIRSSRFFCCPTEEFSNCSTVTIL